MRILRTLAQFAISNFRPPLHTTEVKSSKIESSKKELHINAEPLTLVHSTSLCPWARNLRN